MENTVEQKVLHQIEYQVIESGFHRHEYLPNVKTVLVTEEQQSSCCVVAVIIITYTKGTSINHSIVAFVRKEKGFETSIRNCKYKRIDSIHNTNIWFQD